MSPSNRADRQRRSPLYTIGLTFVLAAVVATAAGALFVTAGGSFFGVRATAFGIGLDQEAEPADAADQADAGDALLQRAREAAWAGRHAEAIAAYDTALAHHPRDRDLALERARVLGWANQYGAAADALAAIADQPGDATGVETAIQRARFLWWAGRAREADSLLVAIRTAHPDVGEADELHALVQPSVEPALDVAARWVDREPGDPRSNLWLARAMVGEGRAAGALGHYRSALVEPGSVEPEVLLEAAGVALGTDSLAFAGQLLERYLRDVDPPDQETRLRLARAYAWSGRFDAAERHYRLVLDRAPAPELRLELARVLAQARRYDDAAAEIGALLDGDRTVDLLRELARVRALDERYGDAADVLAAVLEIRPDDHATRVERARFLWWADRLEAADTELTRVLADRAGHPDAAPLRAEVRAGIQPSVERAGLWLQEEHSPANRLHLARALVRAGRHADALDHYVNALDHYENALANAARSDAAPDPAARSDAAPDPAARGDAAPGDASADRARYRDLTIEAADVADAARVADATRSPDRLIRILERYVAASEAPSPDMRLRLARALAGSPERWPDARAELDLVVAADPSRADAHKLAGDLARWAGDPEAALAHYEQAAALEPGLDSLAEGRRLALDMRQTALAARDVTQVSWAAEMDAFTDTEGFDWVGSAIRGEWRFGRSALSVRLGQGYSRGRPLAGPDVGSLGLGAVVGGRLALNPGLAVLAELGAMSFEDVDAFATWGAGLEYTDADTRALLRYGRTPAVREAATMAALRAGTVMDRAHLEAARYLGPWRVATDLQLQRFRADAGDTDRYAAMLAVDRALAETGVAVGAMVRAIAAADRAPDLPDWGRLYWTPDHYLAPALTVRYGAHVAPGLWLGLRAAPGLAFIDEGDDGPGRYDRDRTAILETGATLGYVRGPWRFEISGDWGGALPDGYNASALRFQLSRFGGPR